MLISGILSGVDAELLDAGKKGGAIHAHPCGSSLSAANPSLTFGECTHDLLALLLVMIVGDVFLPSKALMVSFTIREMSSLRCGSGACVGSSVFNLRSSASGASSDLPRVRITARSMKFSSSRMFPGHSQAVSLFITAAGTPSIFFCICFANFWTK